MAELVPIEKPDPKHFLSLLKAVDSEKPDPEKVKALSEYLTFHPEVIPNSTSMTDHSIEIFLVTYYPNEKMQTLMRGSIEKMKKEIAYDHISVIERMLFDTILINWIPQAYLSNAWQQALKQGNEKAAQFYDGALSGTHRRFTRSVDALARIKKFNINFQINIAMDGGKQIIIQDRK